MRQANHVRFPPVINSVFEGLTQTNVGLLYTIGLSARALDERSLILLRRNWLRMTGMV